MKIANRPLPIAMLTISFLIIVAIGMQFLMWGGEESLFIILCSLCSLLFSLMLAGDRDCYVYNPLFYIFLIVFVGITLRAYFMVYDQENDYVKYQFLGNHGVGYFIIPGAIILGSFICLFLGYRLSNRPYSLRYLSLFAYDHEWNQRKLYRLLLLFTLISFVGIFLFIRSLGIQSILADISSKRYLSVDGGTYRSSLGYYRLMASFIEPAFYIFLLHFIIQRKRIWSISGFVLFILGISNLFFPVFTSSRTGFMYFFVNVLIILGVTKRLSLGFMGVTIPIMILLFASVTSLRSSTEVKIRGADLLDPIIFNRNLLDLSVTANIINEVPEKMPFQYGASVLPLVVAPIPRTIWPEKPSLSMGKDIAYKIYNYNQNIDTAIPPGIIGEFYVNFGLVGVFVGLFLIGVFVKKIYLFFSFDREFNRNKIILYAGVLTNITILLFGGSFNQAVLGFLQAYIPIYLALRYISKRQLTWRGA